MKKSYESSISLFRWTEEDTVKIPKLLLILVVGWAFLRVLLSIFVGGWFPAFLNHFLFGPHLIISDTYRCYPPCPEHYRFDQVLVQVVGKKETASCRYFITPGYHGSCLFPGRQNTFETGNDIPSSP